MIRPISTNPIRTTAIALMTAGALLASSVNNSAKAAVRENQTQVVSREASDAIKANLLPAPTHSNEHNKKIDEKVVALGRNEKEAADNRTLLNNMYKEYGTFETTVLLQRFIDIEHLKQALHLYAYESDTKSVRWEDRGPEETLYLNFGKSIAQENIKIINWLENEFYPSINNKASALYKNGNPSGEDFVTFFDKYVNQMSGFSKEDIKAYNDAVSDFKSKQKNGKSVLGLSDLMAFQIFTIDRIAIRNEISKHKWFNHKTYEGLRRSTLDDYFTTFFVKEAQPTP